MINSKEINSFIERILGFSKPWQVTGVEEELEKGKVTFTLDYPKGTKFKCPKCGKEHTVYDSTFRILRHLDLMEYKAYIKVRIPRVDCEGKKKLYISPLPESTDILPIDLRNEF
jgi:transposase